MTYSVVSPRSPSLHQEWLETDGLGGFASGTASGIRTRRYHALLLAATTPPTGRIVLVNGFEAWVESSSGTVVLTSQFYAPGIVHPDGATHIEAFATDPWPRWTFRLDADLKIEQEVFAAHGTSTVALCWRAAAAVADRGADKSPSPGSLAGMTLCVRPFLSGRDYHSLHHENPAFRFDAETRNGRVIWHPYESLPRIVAFANAEYRHHPTWYRRFQYEEERLRGLESLEDLASPGTFRWDLSAGEAALILIAENVGAASSAPTNAVACLRDLRSSESARRKRFPSRLHRAADAYLVRRGKGKTIVAGYPWFTDWGRDTFIAMRGLCLATGRLDDAREILSEWAGTVSAGMLPNRFPDRGESPEYNSVDASLWFVIAAHEYLCSRASVKREDIQANGEFALHRSAAAPDETRLQKTIGQILSAYAAGTRFGIRLDNDGLLAAGDPGSQLTWMDARVGDWVVTPRVGKPVEVQALWLNALRIAAGFDPKWRAFHERGLEAFRSRFWNEEGGCLYDVIDPDYQSGTADAAFRPNQIFAVGGLPFAVLEGDRARRVVDAVEKRLWTPMGLRSLAPGERGYCGRYEGAVYARDAAYHQGTVWPWLIGPFVEAWVRVRGGGVEAKREARAKFLDPIRKHLDEAGLGHISEIADGDRPHTPRGCPFQAWSVGEALRLSLVVLHEP